MTVPGKISFLLVAALALALSLACSRRVPAAPFPASNEVAGWAKIGETRTFSAAELWSYVDGDAERYVKAGVQSTSTADYKFKDQFDAAIDIYTMSSTAGARTRCGNGSRNAVRSSCNSRPSGSKPTHRHAPSGAPRSLVA